MAVRKSFFDGMWLMEMAPIKNGDAVIGIKLAGRGWTDKMRGIEEKAKAAGNTATAVELLRDRLKDQTSFGEAPDVKIASVRENEAFLTEFTIDVRWSAVEEAKGTAK